jgi:hypothetical protein
MSERVFTIRDRFGNRLSTVRAVSSGDAMAQWEKGKPLFERNRQGASVWPND